MSLLAPTVAVSSDPPQTLLNSNALPAALVESTAERAAVMPAPVPTYSHTQKAPLFLLIAGAAVVLGALSLKDMTAPASPYLGGFAVLMAISALSCRQLTVSDESDRLRICFGPLPLFHRAVEYADIESAAVGRTRILDGWGIHYTVRGGWIWNLWGRDCVVVKLRRGKLRIGSDDAANLAEFLNRRIAER